MFESIHPPTIVENYTFTEYANDNVTASGSPSGTATTRTVTPIMKCFTKLLV
jgi:hypothetical protein